MPRFYIDTTDQARFLHDREGHVFDDVEAASQAALDALPDMARDAPWGARDRTFVAFVRNGEGRPLAQAVMSVSVVWMGVRRPPG